MAERTTGSPSDYLAAERTFLAWIRTGLALMGFGFVVSRFALFLETLQGGTASAHGSPYGISFWFGTGLIVLGVIVNLLCARHHIHLVRSLNRGDAEITRPSRLALTLAILLAVLGLGMAVFLIWVHDPSSSNVQPSQEKSMNSNSEHGIISIPSHHSVDETVDKIQSALESKGVKLFALVDHSGEAERAGMHMRPTKLLIFGNPKAGTPLMVAVPSLAIDLPLKMLVAEDAEGKVWISYNSPAYIQARHNLPQEWAQAYSATGVDVLAANVAE